MGILGYPVTRPITLSRYALTGLIIFGILFITLVTLINTIAVGYEPVSITLNEYNPQVKLWYQKILPESWVPKTMHCDLATIKLDEGTPARSHRDWPIAVSTRGLFPYTLIGYADGNTGSPIEGMTYDGSPLCNCSIVWISFIHPLHETTQLKVPPLIYSEIYTGSDDVQHDCQSIPIPSTRSQHKPQQQISFRFQFCSNYYHFPRIVSTNSTASRPVNPA